MWVLFVFGRRWWDGTYISKKSLNICVCVCVSIFYFDENLLHFFNAKYISVSVRLVELWEGWRWSQGRKTEAEHTQTWGHLASCQHTWHSIILVLFQERFPSTQLPLPSPVPCFSTFGIVHLIQHAFFLALLMHMPQTPSTKGKC